jgi:hypothetical protein
MDTERLKDQSGFITFKDLAKELDETQYKLKNELLQNQSEVKKELMVNQSEVKKEFARRMDKSDKQVEKLSDKVEGINDKVIDLKDLVIPLTIAMNATAENTKEMAAFLKESTENQSSINETFREKFHGQDLSIEGLKFATNSMEEKKKYNLGVTVAGIGLAGTFIAGLFQLAPIIFK